MLRSLVAVLLCFCAGLCTPVVADDIPPQLQPVLAWGTRGDGDGEFHSPIGIAIDKHDVIYVTEFKNNRVQRFDTQGKFLGKLAVAEMPGGIAVNDEGEIFVAPMMQHKICVYNTAGELLREWGKKGTGDGEFDQPGGLALNAEGHLYVADQVNRRIQYFTREGKFLGKWGEYGTAVGQFDGIEGKLNRVGGPNFVSVDRHGHIWTTEARAGRIQQFTPTGEPISHFGSNSTDPGGFGGRPKNLPGPIGILVDPHDRVWVTATNHRVQAFNTQGTLLFGFESLEPGNDPGQFETPHGLAMDSAGFLYVVDSQNQRVQKIQIKEPPTK